MHAKHTRRGIAAAAASTPAADGAMVKGLPAGSQAREQAAAPGWVASFVLLPEGAAGSPVRAADDAALAVPSWQTPIHVRSISPHTADLSTPVELPLSAEHEPHRGALAAGKSPELAPSLAQHVSCMHSDQDSHAAAEEGDDFLASTVVMPIPAGAFALSSTAAELPEAAEERQLQGTMAKADWPQVRSTFAEEMSGPQPSQKVDDTAEAGIRALPCDNVMLTPARSTVRSAESSTPVGLPGVAGDAPLEDGPAAAAADSPEYTQSFAQKAAAMHPPAGDDSAATRAATQPVADGATNIPVGHTSEHDAPAATAGDVAEGLSPKLDSPEVPLDPDQDMAGRHPPTNEDMAGTHPPTKEEPAGTPPPTKEDMAGTHPPTQEGNAEAGVAALPAATEVTSTPMRHASGRAELSENSEPEGAASGLDSPEFAPEFAQEVARMLLASSPKSSPGRRPGHSRDCSVIPHSAAKGTRIESALDICPSLDSSVVQTNTSSYWPS